jgi:hypothetical protein
MARHTQLRLLPALTVLYFFGQPARYAPALAARGYKLLFVARKGTRVSASFRGLGLTRIGVTTQM